MLERFADRWAYRLCEVAPLKHRRARKDIGPVTLERRGDDDVGGGLFVQRGFLSPLIFRQSGIAEREDREAN